MPVTTYNNITHFTAIFQNRLDKLIPECQTTVDFAQQEMMEVTAETIGTIVQSSIQITTINTLRFNFTGLMPFLSMNQHCQGTGGKITTNNTSIKFYLNLQTNGQMDSSILPYTSSTLSFNLLHTND